MPSKVDFKNTHINFTILNCKGKKKILKSFRERNNRDIQKIWNQNDINFSIAALK